MPVIFKPGLRYFWRQTYTAAFLGAAFFTGLGYAGVYIYRVPRLPRCQECALPTGDKANIKRLKQSFLHTLEAREPATRRVKMVRKKHKERSLVCFVQALQGMRVVVELRQDTIARGMLDSVDNYMNLVMSDVSYAPLQGPKQELQHLYIKGHHIRFIHIPSKVNPKTAVEEHRERVAAAKIVHAREAQPVARLPKGVQFEDPNQEVSEEDQEEQNEQGVGRTYHGCEDEYQGEGAQGGSGGWQQGGGSGNWQAGGLSELVEGLDSAEAKEVQESLAAIAQEETSLAGVGQRGIDLPAVKLELPEEAVGEQPLGQEPDGEALPEQEAVGAQHIEREESVQQGGGGGQAVEANDEEDLYRDLYGIKMESIDPNAGQAVDEPASQSSTPSDGQEDWEKEALQDSLFQGGQSSDESEGGGHERVDAMETD